MNTMPLFARSELDGLLGCAILKEAGYGGEIEFLNPLDALSNLSQNDDKDVRVNLPGAQGLRWDRNCWAEENLADKSATASGTILEALDDAALTQRFSEWLPDLEKWQTHRLDPQDFLSPSPTLLLAALCDPATGLGRYRDFIVSNYFFLLDLVDQLRSQPADVLIHLGDVQDRLDLMASRRGAHEEQIRRTVKGSGLLLIQDLREEYRIEPGNPMTKHLIAPAHEAILTLFWDKNHRKVSVGISGALGVEQTVHLGSLLQPFEGGGDRYSAIAQVLPDRVDEVIDRVKGSFTQEASK